MSERDDVGLVVTAYLAGQSVPIPEEERNAAVRRALLVFAAGGGLGREPDLEDPAVLELAAALDELPADDLPTVTAAAESLRADPELAWRSFALSLLADELADE